MGWQDKRCCASSPCEHVRLYRNTRLWLSSTRCYYLIYLQCPCLMYFMIYLIHAAPSFIPIPTVFSILLFIATVTTAVFTSLLLLFHYCYFHKTVTTDKLLRARLLSGAAELKTHLLRLISILWLPLCRINKLGFTSLEDCGDPLYLWVISLLSSVFAW